MLVAFRVEMAADEVRSLVTNILTINKVDSYMSFLPNVTVDFCLEFGQALLDVRQVCILRVLFTYQSVLRCSTSPSIAIYELKQRP